MVAWNELAKLYDPKNVWIVSSSRQKLDDFGILFEKEDNWLICWLPFCLYEKTSALGAPSNWENIQIWKRTQKELGKLAGCWLY